MDKPTSEVIMFDSEEAAEYHTGLKGWVDRFGNYFGEDERAAQYSGCTHKACETCGEPVEKSHTKCKGCRHNHDLERYAAREFKEWDGETPLFSQELDRYIFGLDELEAEGFGTDLATLRFVVCDPVKLSSIEEDHWEDELPEDGELADEVAEALGVFDQVLAEAGTVAWEPGKYRTSVT